MNDKEFKRIQESLSDDIAAAEKKAAFRFLEYFRKLVKQYNYSRHKITLLCGMGACCVLVDGELLESRSHWKTNAALKLLWDIEEFLDWDWGAWLDGQSLN